MKVKTIAAVIATLSITGCASMIDGKNQTLTLSTSGDTDKLNTECNLTNSKGTWTTDSKESIFINRDHADLLISCENDKQEGEKVVVSSASVGYMALNFIMWDLCTISCLIDHSTGALYEYPVNVTVPMRDKVSAPHLTSESSVAEKTGNEASK